jgi:predicted ribosomally synthesized peptide with SipW-like signal peptide
MISRKILSSIVIIALLALSLGYGAIAVFTDEETTETNILTAGTLDLTVNDENEPLTLKIEVSNIAPGYDSGYYKWNCKNVGSLTGNLTVTFSAIVNDDNGLNDPETDAGDSTGGDGEGELGQYLKPKGMWGPYGWSVPSIVISVWQTGPTNPWGTPGLNGWGDKTFVYGALAPGAEIAMFLQLTLDENLRIWDGTKWIEVDDNIIQSDSVEFTITFKLEQIV